MDFRYNTLALAVCASLSFLVAVARASPDAPLPKDLPAYGEDKPLPPPQIEKKTLGNGLAIWVVPREGLPRVDYVLAFQNAGFARDDPQHPGFAGYLASLLNEGSAKHDSRAIAESAQSYGGSVSANAVSDGIVITANALTSKAALMLELLAEMVRQPSFPAAEIKLAKANALQQLKADEAQPAFRAEREIGKVLYGDHPYARTQPTEASIAALTPELLKAEHAKRFRPDRALLVIAGRIAPAQAFAFAEDAFGEWKSQRSAPPPIASASQNASPTRVLLQRSGSVQTTIRLGQPAVAANHPDHIPLHVAAALIGGGFSSRLMRNLREDKGYTYSTGASYRFNRAGGGMVGRADVRNEVTGAALKEFMQEYRRLGSEPVPAEELDVSKRYIAGNHLIRTQLQGALATALASNWLVGLPPEYLAEFVRGIRQVSAAQVMAMGRKYFDPARQSIVVVADEAVVAEQLKVHGEWTTRKPSAIEPKAALHYPPAARVNQIDPYHGERVADPYRWLEHLDAAETRAWIEAQNRLAQTHLEGTPAHAWFKRRLTELWDYERYGVPVKKSGRYFWLRNDGLQNHGVLYVAESLDAEPRILLDPNALSVDGTISMSDFEASPDGRLIAYALSNGGSDWNTWRVRDVASGRDLPDALCHTKITRPSWTADSSGFYYSRYPIDESGDASRRESCDRGDGSRQVSIFHHRIGESQSADQLVYAVSDHPTRNPYGKVSEDGRFLIIDVFEAGGVYAVANLRGGSEYGEAWHEAGARLKKQNVFDDFIAAAQWLIDQRYTSKHKLAVAGGSNGGLLVGAVITQRPDLFAAALPRVGVLDMLRYHTASANARQWSSDYGLSENPEEYRALRAYSPYHNVRAGACYPPTLITTADHDDRVAPWHSFKFAAALQAAQGCDNPVLIRVETRAGHGAGKPTWMQIEDIANQWAFLTRHLDMKLPDTNPKISRVDFVK